VDDVDDVDVDVDVDVDAVDDPESEVRQDGEGEGEGFLLPSLFTGWVGGTAPPAGHGGWVCRGASCCAA
jgi:hypothetical protein